MDAAPSEVRSALAIDPETRDWSIPIALVSGVRS